MPIAAFDPSLTHLGWVIFDEAKTGRESVLEAGVFRTEPSEGLLVQRLIKQRTRVAEFLAAKGIKFVTMEAPIWGEFSTELLFALNQFLHEVFLAQGTFVLYIQSSTWKKMMFPDMNPQDVTKAHSSHLAKVELDKRGKRFSEHVADAYHLGKIGHRFHKWYFQKVLKDSDLTPEEWDLFCGKKTFTKGPRKGITEYYGLIYRENDQFFDFGKRSDRTPKIIEEETKKEITDGNETSAKGSPKDGHQGYFDRSRVL